MDLRLYDTLTREKRVFTPIDPSNVRMYVCGPTVYDFAHIGNARPVIVFDVLFRVLRQLYRADHVTYVRNITDVDDKINNRAARDFPGLPPANPRTTRDRFCFAAAGWKDGYGDADQAIDRARPCLRSRRRGVVRHPVDAGLWRAVGPKARRAAGRRARRRRCT
jgi:hypothetical protein